MTAPPDPSLVAPPQFTNTQQGVFLFSVSAVLQRIFSFGVALILLRALSLYEYGLWKLVFSFVGIAQIFLFPTMRGVLVSDIARARAAKALPDIKRLLRSYALFQCLIGIALGGILFAGTWMIPAWRAHPLASLIRWAALLVPLGGVREVFQLAFHSHARFRALAFWYFLDIAAPLAFLFVYIVFANKGVVGVPMAYTFAYVIEILFFLPFFFRTLRYLRGVRATPAPLLRRYMFAHGKWASMNEYVGSLSAYARIWVIKAMAGVEAVALYSAAEGLFLQVQMFNPLYIPLQTTLAGAVNERQRFAQLFVRGSKYATLLYLAIGIFAAVISAPFITFFFPKYIPALPLLYIFFLSMPLQGVNSMIQLAFYALQSQRTIFIASLIKIAGVLAVAPILLRTIGVYGAPFEFVLTFFALVVVRFRVLRAKIPDIRLPPLFFISFDSYDKTTVQQLIAVARDRMQWKKNRASPAYKIVHPPQ